MGVRALKTTWFVKMRSYSSRVCSEANMSTVFIRRGEATETREKVPREDKLKITKRFWQAPEAREDMSRFFLRAPKEDVSDCWPPELGDDKFLLL